MSSRREFPSKIPNHSVALGWDNPLMSFFAQVERDQDDDDERDPIVLWLGGNPHEIAAPEQMVERLRPYFDLTGPLLDQLRGDRFADVDRGPTRAQRDGLDIASTS
jgi:hypothetical protein